MNSLGALHSEARQIFAHALERSSIPSAFDRRIHFENHSLIRRPGANAPPLSIPLGDYEQIDVIAVGKAAAAMLDALVQRLPRAFIEELVESRPQALRGICCAPSLPSRRHSGIDYYAGGHPAPNPDSFRSARAALELLGKAGKKTFVFFLISGGGSAMFEAPLDPRIPLDETIAFHRALVGSGATITEINTVRKHFSAVKGGRLAAAAADAAKYSLLVSDVPADHLDALASGPTLPDRSTVQECREILERYRLLEQFAPGVRQFFANPDLPETPGKKGRAGPGMDKDPAAQVDILLSNQDLLDAAGEFASLRGWTVVIDNACDDWDYRQAARYLLKRLHELRRKHPRVCLLSGGEVTVRLNRDPGAGGRNQQFALACALELAGRSPALPGKESESLAAAGAPIAVLSAGSDGVDGLSPAAGAIADSTTAARAEASGFDPSAALRGFDSYPLFTALGDTVMTGPTNNNLRDLRILLSGDAG